MYNREGLWKSINLNFRGILWLSKKKKPQSAFSHPNNIIFPLSSKKKEINIQLLPFILGCESAFERWSIYIANFWWKSLKNRNLHFTRLPPQISLSKKIVFCPTSIQITLTGLSRHRSFLLLWSRDHPIYLKQWKLRAPLRTSPSSG